MKKSFFAQIGLLITTALFVSASFAGGPTLRPDAPPQVDAHIAKHKELSPFANRYGWKYAATNGRCTTEGQYVEQRNQAYFNHCRDYAGNDGITRRVVFNDKSGNGAAQRIYEVRKDSSRLVVTFQDAVVVSDMTGTVSPGSTTPPAVAGRQETPEEAVGNLLGIIRGVIKPR